jgi:glycosyltransferase involved in cell wall biosynthesis
LTTATALPLSVVIVAKNEAHNLPRCLASVQGWVSESVVALNATTDDSAAVCARFGATAHTLPWLGYRDTKNAALALASQNWVLSLDADEEVSAELRQAIETFFAHGDADRHSGARFPRKVFFMSRWITHGDWYPDYCLRLFRRDRAHWGGDAHVHEKIELEGPAATLRADLHHYPFPTVDHCLAKIPVYAELFAKQQIARGKRFSFFSALVRPPWRFFRAYVLRRGFLDGFPGLCVAWLTAFGAFMRYSRWAELQTESKPPHA